MHFKSKLYISLAISFILLITSLYISIQSINSTSKMIEHIEQKQLKLNYLASKLNSDIEINQSNILQAIILKDRDSIKSIHTSFDALYNLVNELDILIQSSDVSELMKIIDVIKRRVVGYKAVENSLIEALESKESEDIQDALIGYNAITLKFSEDTNKLTNISNTQLYEDISLLKQSNKESNKTIFASFIIAFILIFFSVKRLISLHDKAKMRLYRAEKAEQEQKKLQSQLLKYNDDLEDEITKKTKELHQKIYTNFISGLPNRNKFLEDTHKFAFKQMALLNIDKFQKFNDVYGEEIGNIAIRLSAEFLNSQIDDENTTLYHLGGDEFAFLVKDSKKVNNNAFIEKIEQILKNYKNETFIYEDKRFKFMMSAGISFAGKKKILAFADMALKDAKKRNIQLSIFNSEKDLEQLHKDDIECHRKLLHAFENEKVISFFQPIFPLQDSDKTTKYESLVRIEDEDSNIIPPLKFINVAKAHRIYHKLTTTIVNNTLSTIEKFNTPCSINISMEDIDNERTLKMLYSKFNAFEHNNLLTIELLETEEFKDYKSVYDFCIKVRSYGIKIALDDFGAGYSNFSHILKLPVDFIKIDASLISNIDRDQHSKIMVETIVNLAKKLNIETIAEFVSSKEILDVVKELKVDYAQGYHIGKPEPIENHLNKKRLT